MILGAPICLQLLKTVWGGEFFFPYRGNSLWLILCLSTFKIFFLSTYSDAKEKHYERECEISSVQYNIFEKNLSLFSFGKTSWISMKPACSGRSWTLIRMLEFLSCLSIASVDGKQHLSEVVFSALSDFRYKEDDETTGTAHLMLTFFSDIRWCQENNEPSEPLEGFPQKSMNR